MTQVESRVTIHMVAGFDGSIARRDGGVDWLETTDTFDGGKSMDPGVVGEFLARWAAMSWVREMDMPRAMIVRCSLEHPEAPAMDAPLRASIDGFSSTRREIGG